MLSGYTSPRQFAFYDPALSLWRTWLPYSHAVSTVYSQTWPKQGTTHCGVAYEPATSEPRTAGNACSCSPGPQETPVLPTFCAARGGAATKITRLLRTPTAARSSSTGTDPVIRRAAGHEIDLVDIATQFKVTPASQPPALPAAADRSPGSEQPALLPTPAAVPTWQAPQEHTAWRRRNGRTRPCDSQAAAAPLPEPRPADTQSRPANQHAPSGY